MNIRVIILAISSLFISTRSYTQGLYWESTTSISALGDTERRSETYYMPKMLKEVSGDQETIIRLDKKVFYLVNSQEKTYSEMTFDELAAMATSTATNLKGKLSEMQSQLKDLPKDQQEMIGKILGKNAPGDAAGEATIEVRKTGQKKTFGGYACTENKIIRGGKDLMTIWSTKDLPRGFEAMEKDLGDLKERLMSMDPRGEGKAMGEGMKMIDGFPIRVESEWMTNTVTKIEPHATPRGAFEIPAGFTKKKSNWFTPAEQGQDNE